MMVQSSELRVFILNSLIGCVNVLAETVGVVVRIKQRLTASDSHRRCFESCDFWLRTFMKASLYSPSYARNYCADDPWFGHSTVTFSMLTTTSPLALTVAFMW